MKPVGLFYRRHHHLVLPVIWLGILLALQPAAAQEHIRFGHLNLEDGLSQSSVYSILQDDRGFLWLGTHDGLNKYNGYEFKVYKNNPDDPETISNNFIMSMCKAERGNVWVGTFRGLNLLDPIHDRFTSLLHDPNDPHSISNNSIRALLVDRQGILWVGTQGGGLNRFDPKTEKFVHFRHDPNDPTSLSDDSIYDLFEDRQGNLWVGTRVGGLSLLNRENGTFTNYPHKEINRAKGMDSRVRTIFQDRFDTLWVGTDDGLKKFDAQTETYQTYRMEDGNHQSLRSNRIWTIYEDRTGILWLGTDSGLAKMDRETEIFDAFQHNPGDPKSLSNDRVYSLFTDKSNVLWIGTELGLNKYNTSSKRFTHFKRDPNNDKGFTDDSIYAVHDDRFGNIWIGTDNSGINIYNPQKRSVRRLQHKEGDENSLSHQHVNAIFRDHQNTMWVGTDAGIDRYDEAKGGFTNFNHDPNDPHSLSADRIWAIYEDRSNVLWVGTADGGLNRFDRDSGQFEIFSHDPHNDKTLSHNRVRCIYEDRAGGFWIGTHGGLNKFDRTTGVFNVYKPEAGNPSALSSDQINAVIELKDMPGTLWVATYGGGLNKFDQMTLTATSFREKQGLANDVVYGLLEDGENNLWLSTNKGVSKFMTSAETFKNYDVKDGLQSNEFNSGAFFKNADGRMFFGGINGFNAFYPEKVIDNPHQPPVVFTAFKKFNEPFDLETPVSVASAIELSYQDSVISFEFVALDFVDPNKNHFAYMLEGFKDNWIQLRNQRNVTFTNLDAGDYTLRVRASNNDGVWNNEGASLHLTMIPPPWKTWWAYTLYGLAFFGAVFGYIRYRVHVNELELRRQEELNLILEQKVRERTEELQKKTVEVIDAHRQLVTQEKMASLGTLTAGVAHEINTPVGIGMTAVSHLADSTQALVKDYEEQKLTQKSMKQFITNCMEATSILMSNLKRAADLIQSFKQVAVDQASEVRRKFNVKQYLEHDVLTSLVGKLKSSKHHIQIDCPDDLEIDSFPGCFSQIATNFVSNSLMHGYDQDDTGNLRFRIQQKGDFIFFEYSDDGKGIDPENLKRIFDPFFTTSRGTGATGLGLHVVYNLVTQQLAGSIDCESTPGKGVSFSIRIPTKPKQTTTGGEVMAAT